MWLGNGAQWAVNKQYALAVGASLDCQIKAKQKLGCRPQPLCPSNNMKSYIHYGPNRMIVTYDIVTDFTTWQYRNTDLAQQHRCAAVSWFWKLSVTQLYIVLGRITWHSADWPWRAITRAAAVQEEENSQDSNPNIHTYVQLYSNVIHISQTLRLLLLIPVRSTL